MDVYERAIAWTEKHDVRLKCLNDKPVNTAGEFILYWMVGARRISWNNAMDRAIHWSNQLKKPVLVVEALSYRYQWASERHHQFILDGMIDNHIEAEHQGITYRCFVSHEGDEGAGLIESLAENACLIVSDDYPCFFIPKMLNALSDRLQIKMEAIDSNGVIPLSVSEKPHTTAYAFRRFVQKNFVQGLETFALENPGRLQRYHFQDTSRLNPRLNRSPLLESGEMRYKLSDIPLDRGVKKGVLKGGARAAGERANRFIQLALGRYDEDRNSVDPGGTSLLSPYLHYGHVSSQYVVSSILNNANWGPEQACEKAHGSRGGWWNLPGGEEAFLDQIITWRELGYHFCHHHRSTHGTFETLPNWAKESLGIHRGDPRPYVYTLAEFENSRTHDQVWNAAQRELVTTGLMHNYLRMLWAKKVLEWTERPEDALEILIHLNNKYALDGRDPNSYSGIMWTFGLFDRAWGPERPIYGKVRYMTSESTKRKLKLKPYLEKYAPQN